MGARKSFIGLSGIVLVGAPTLAVLAAWAGKWPVWFVVSTGLSTVLLVLVGVWHERVGRSLGGRFERFLSDAHSPTLQRRCWTVIALVVGLSLLALLARVGDWPWLTLSIGVGAGIAYWGTKVCPAQNPKRALAAVAIGGFAMSLAANFFVGVVSGQTTVAATTSEWAKIDSKLNQLVRGQTTIITTQVEQGKVQTRTLDNSEKLLAIEAIKANPGLSDTDKQQQILAITSPTPTAGSQQEPPLRLSPDIAAFLERMAKHAPLIDQVRTANALGKLDEAAGLRDQYLAEMTQAREQQDYAAFVAFGDTEWLAQRYNQAGAWYEKALAIRDDEFEIVNKAGLSFVNVRAGKDYASAMVRAEQWLRQGVTLATAQGTDNPNLAVALNNLAQLLKATNRLGEAEPLMRRALAIDEASFGKEHPNVARDLNNLAALLHATNRLGEAEPLMRRALAIDEASFGKEHPDVASDLNNLAQLLQATNRLGEAEPLMRRALAIDEARFGKEHPDVASDLNNLAQLLQATNRLGEAEPLMRRALAIDEASFGKEHPRVATELNNLAQLLQDTNRLGEAEPLMRRAVGIELKTTAAQKHHTPNLRVILGNYEKMLVAAGMTRAKARADIAALCGEYGVEIDR